MRETKFIEQNKEKWEEVERLMEATDQDPEKLNEHFIQVTDDLAHARTFYPNRSVRVYLNYLAQKIFTSIYRGKKTDRNRLVQFWKEELPQLVYESRNEFRTALAVFGLAMLIGAVSSHFDPEFPRHIMGDDYVNMTLENIESGDPMAVYKQKGEFGMSVGIAANNLWVAFLTFVMGAVYAIGTIWILIKNGVMVGAFQYFFVNEGVFWESFLTIWTHGTLEISAIVIAGAAGLTMGRGLVFPGTFSRLKAFQLSARRGLKIMIGIAPIILMAGFIEGYLTRYTETPDAVRLAFILICLAFVLIYFVWYPWYKAKRGFDSDVLKTSVTPERQRDINFIEMKSLGQLFSEVFLFLKKYFRTIFLTTTLASVFWCLILFLFSDEVPRYTMTSLAGSHSIWDLAGSYFSNEHFRLLSILNGLTFGAVALVVCLKMTKDANVEPKFHWLINYSKMIVCCTGLAAILVAPTWLLFLLGLTIPIILIWMYVMVGENRSLFNSATRTLNIAGSNFWQMMGLFIILGMTGAMFILIADTLVMRVILEAIGLNVSFSNAELSDFYAILSSFFGILLFKLVFAMLMIGSALLFYNLREVKDASLLKERIEQIGSQKKIRGLEWEG